MSVIDSDTVHSENARPVVFRDKKLVVPAHKSSLHLLDDSRSSSFNAIGLEDSKDVVRIDLGDVDEILRHTPDGRQVGSFGDDFPLRQQYQYQYNGTDIADTHSELSLVVKDLHTSADIWHFMDDGFSATPLDNVDQEELLR